MQGVFHRANGLHWRALDGGQFGIDEFGIKRGVVNQDRRTVDEFEQIVGNGFEQRFVAEKFGGQAMHRERTFVRIALRIEVMMKVSAGELAIDHFNRADFHQFVSQFRLKTGGFRIEYDVTHVYSSFCSACVFSCACACTLATPRLANSSARSLSA